MRVTKMEHHILTQSGTDRELGWTYYSLKNDTVCIKGRYVKRRITGHNHVCGNKIRRANELFREVDISFHKDLKKYAEAYNRQLLPEKKCYLNHYNVFIKAICNGKVSLWEMESLSVFVGVYGNTVESWVSSGLLPKVRVSLEGNECFCGDTGIRVEMPERICLRKGDKCRVRLGGVELVIAREE